MNIRDYHIYHTRDDLPTHLWQHCQDIDETGMQIFHHRFCVTIMPLFVPVLIEELLKIREDAANRTIVDHGPGAYLTRIERPYRLEVLLEFAETGVFDHQPSEYWKVLSFAWTDSEISESDPVWGQLLAIDLPGKEAIMSAGDKYVLAELPEFFTVWRGVHGQNEDEALVASLNGHSWSLSPDVAEKFARRLSTGTGSWIARSEVCKEDVFCYLDRRGEQEIILLPSTMKDHDIEITPVSNLSKSFSPGF